MEVRYTRHALVDSMPDEKIAREEVEAAIRKAEMRTRIAGNKFKCRYRDLEVVCVKTEGYWLVVTCYRIRS
ncbi:MAG: hypothetical protein V1787_06410 [Candidatus Micrarchaeota archaeon]